MKKMFQKLSVFLYVSLIASTRDVFAAMDAGYCGAPPVQHSISISRGAFENTTLATTGSTLSMSKEALNASWLIKDEPGADLSMGFNFEYTIFDFDSSIVPMTNGHLHAWDFPVSWYKGGKSTSMQYFVAPVISVSSNVLRNPGLLDRDGLHIDAGVVYRYNNRVMGVRSDHRFGDFQVYPVIGYCWAPSAELNFQLAFPDIGMWTAMNEKLLLRIYIGPDGNKWHVFNKDKSLDSDFTYRTIVQGISLQWNTGSYSQIIFGFEKHTRRRLDFLLDDLSVVNSHDGSVSSFRVEAKIVF